MTKHRTFVAIDFETADHGPDSACAVALVRVESLEIVERRVQLLRPPRPHIIFSHIHGLTWAELDDAPTFADAWPRLADMLDGADELAAHNAGFDRSVLEACCRCAGHPIPPQRFICSMQIARRTWGIYPTRLPDVCRCLKLELKHHDAGSDAEACARIVIAARRLNLDRRSESATRPPGVVRRAWTGKVDPS